MAFALNGNILLNPTTHKWVIPPSYGTSGVGKVLYGGIFAYELNWGLLTQEEYNVLTHTYMSGTCIATLPEWNGVAVEPDVYEFQSYTGTFLGLPEYQSHFEGTYLGVKVLINHVIV